MTYRVTHIQFDWLDCEDDYDGSEMRANIEKAKSLTYASQLPRRVSTTNL